MYDNIKFIQQDDLFEDGEKMSLTVRFYVLALDHVVKGAQPVVVEMSHYGDSSEVVDQCFGTDATIKSLEFPEWGYIYDNGSDAETTEKRSGSGNTPLRYTTAEELAHLKMPDWVGVFDLAMMAYVKTLAEHQPKTIVVLELW